MARKIRTTSKSKALENALTQIERAHGKGAIMKMGSDSSRIQIESISTGR